MQSPFTFESMCTTQKDLSLQPYYNITSDKVNSKRHYYEYQPTNSCYTQDLHKYSIVEQLRKFRSWQHDSCHKYAGKGHPHDRSTKFNSQINLICRYTKSILLKKENTFRNASNLNVDI